MCLRVCASLPSVFVCLRIVRSANHVVFGAFTSHRSALLILPPRLGAHRVAHDLRTCVPSDLGTERDTILAGTHAGTFWESARDTSGQCGTAWESPRDTSLTRTRIELHLCSYGIDPEASQNGGVPSDVCFPLELVWA